MKLRSYDYACEGCGHTFIKLFDLDTEEVPEYYGCECGDKADKLFGAPMVLKASYPDGHNRGDNYKKLKEANKVEKEMYRIHPDKRKDHKKQISKLKKVKK